MNFRAPRGLVSKLSSCLQCNRLTGRQCCRLRCFLGSVYHELVCGAGENHSRQIGREASNPLLAQAEPAIGGLLNFFPAQN